MPIQQMFLGGGAAGEVYWMITWTTNSLSGSNASNSYSINDMEIDSSGNMYCSGRCKDYTGFGNDSDENGGFVIQIKKDGTLGWLRYVGTTAANIAYGLALDSSKNVHVFGKLTEFVSGLTEPGYISKYNSSGTHQSTTSTNYLRGGPDQHDGRIALTSSSFPTGWTSTTYYANGSSISGPGGTGEYRIFYNPNISNPWRLSFGTASAEGNNHKVLTDYMTSNYSGEWIMGKYRDSSSAVRFFDILNVSSSATKECIVTAGSYNSAFPATIVLSTLDGTSNVAGQGGVQWVMKVDYTPTSSSQDGVTDIKIDSSNNIYMLSKCKRDTNRSGTILSKWHPSGKMIWARWVGNIYSNNKYIELRSFDFDSNDDVICVGDENHDTQQWTIVIKYNQAGEQQWQRRIKPSTNHVRAARGVSIDKDDNDKIFICGQGNTISGGGGNRAWLIQTNADCSSIGNEKTFNTTDPSGADERWYHIKVQDDAIFIGGYKYGQLQSNNSVKSGFAVKVPKDFSLTGTYGNVTYGNPTGNCSIVSNPNFPQYPLVPSPTTDDWVEMVYPMPTNNGLNYASNSTSSTTSSNPNFDTELVEA